MALGSSSTEAEMQHTCRELEYPDLTGYDFFTESHNVKIFRKYNEVSGLYEYKIYGYMENIDPATCAQVYIDLAYRRTWDSYVNELREIEADGTTYVYWQVNFPFPMSNRDYVYVRSYQEMEVNGQMVYVGLARGCETAAIPERSGVVRVTEYISDSALTADGKGGTKAFMKYYDNPGGSIPTWLINWGAKTGVPTFLSTMETACRGYNEYLQNKEEASEGAVQQM